MNTFSLKHVVRTNRDSMQCIGELYEDNCLVLCDSERTERGDAFFCHPTRIDSLLVSICQEGEMEYSTDMDRLIVKKNMMVCIRPGEIFQISEHKGGKFSSILMDVELIEQMKIPMTKILSYTSFLKRGIMNFELDEARMNEILSLMRILSNVIKSDRGQLFYHEKVRSFLQLIFYTCASIFFEGQNTEDAIREIKSPREEKYLNDFFKHVRVHYDKERTVKYYADCVHLSPKYLSSIVKRLTGKTASEWIDELVILEAKNLLKNSDMTVQQVSNTLNFSTQSFFGKYFKHHTGMSPREYQVK